MDAADQFVLSTARADDEAVVVRAKGELDFATLPGLMEAIEAAVRDGAVLCIVDCERVTFIDTETLKALIALRRKLAHAGQCLRLCNCSRQVERVVSILSIGDELGCGPEEPQGAT